MRSISALIIVLTVGVSVARADGVGVVVTGEATVQPQLVRFVEAWLRDHHHQLVSGPLPPDAINSLVDCFVIQDEDCARGVIDKRSKASSVVYARVDIAPAGDLERTVTVVAYWFDKGAPSVAERRFCERCNDQSLRATADEVMTALAKAARKGSGRLKCTSKPVGARVAVDTEAVGVTPLDHEIAPGPHKITVTHDRHVVETREVVVKSGETTTLDVPLALVDGDDKHPRNSRLVPGLVIGAGGAVAVVGVVLFVTSEEDTGEKPTYRETRLGGTLLGMAGVAAVGVGSYLWYRASKTERPTSAPTAAVVRGGAVLGWGGSF